jgi:hypothetical protein
MCCSIWIGNQLACWLVVWCSVANYLLASRGMFCSNISPYSGGFKTMNIQALFATVAMAGATSIAT